MCFNIMNYWNIPDDDPKMTKIIKTHTLKDCNTQLREMRRKRRETAKKKNRPWLGSSGYHGMESKWDKEKKTQEQQMKEKLEESMINDGFCDKIRDKLMNDMVDKVIPMVVTVVIQQKEMENVSTNGLIHSVPQEAGHLKVSIDLIYGNHHSFLLPVSPIEEAVYLLVHLNTCLRMLHSLMPISRMENKYAFVNPKEITSTRWLKTLKHHRIVKHVNKAVTRFKKNTTTRSRLCPTSWTFPQNIWKDTIPFAVGLLDERLKGNAGMESCVKGNARTECENE
ncbi:hypothetical protein LXL04_019207 [Taraxacum kok-saghyz]